MVVAAMAAKSEGGPSQNRQTIGPRISVSGKGGNSRIFQPGGAKDLPPQNTQNTQTKNRKDFPTSAHPYFAD
jgi:hypothetical protein